MLNKVQVKPNGNKSEADIAEAAMTAGSAQSLLDTVGPRLERQMKVLIGGFVNAPAELGALLQYQAKIAALWHITNSLTDIARRGRPALDAFDELLKSKMNEE